MSTIDWASLRQNADDAMRPAPDGEYTLKVKKAEAKTASTGSQMIAVNFVIEGGPSHGKGVFWNLVLSPDNAFALNMFFKRLDAFGIDPTMNGGLSMEQIASMMEGQMVDATLGHREYQNVVRNEVTEVRRNPMSSPRAYSAASSPAASATPAVSNQPPTPQVSTAPPTPSPTAAPVPTPPPASGVSAPPDEPF